MDIVCIAYTNSFCYGHTKARVFNIWDSRAILRMDLIWIPQSKYGMASLRPLCSILWIVRPYEGWTEFGHSMVANVWIIEALVLNLMDTSAI